MEPLQLELDVAALVKLAKRPHDDNGPCIRAAILADTSTQLLTMMLRGYARHLGYNLELFEAEFDQIEFNVFDPQSPLHQFKPETVIIYLAAERIACGYGSLSAAERSSTCENLTRRVESLYESLSSHGYQTIFFNLVNPHHGVFGNFGNKVAWSLENQIRRFNVELSRLAVEKSDFNVYDLAALQAAIGSATLFDPKLYYTSKFAIAPAALPRVARGLAKMLAARKGSFIKCLILDLDNTLWGGVIGDDGMDRIQIGELGLGRAFSSFQSWLKLMKDRGIVLAVCSKNEDANAREPFLKHPEMILRLDDIAVFVANWNDKASNIRFIKSIIDIDFGAMAFLDDNPVERQLVRESFPRMIVPELPEDPSEYVTFLAGLDLFETASYTAQDSQRTNEYQAEVKRSNEREKFVDLADFLRSLNMRGAVKPFSPFNIPRVTQLTQRSNQFNLRTVRYTEKQIADIAASESHVAMAIELRDKYGDNGMISVIILEKQENTLFVDTWLMSCRVLGRGVEQFVLNNIVKKASELGMSTICGEYVPTAKNGMVKDHYQKLGFQSAGANRWTLSVADYREYPVHIAVEATTEDPGQAAPGHATTEPALAAPLTV